MTSMKEFAEDTKVKNEVAIITKQMLDSVCLGISDMTPFVEMVTRNTKANEESYKEALVEDPEHPGYYTAESVHDVFKQLIVISVASFEVMCLSIESKGRDND